jgi:hypothetical protein
VTRKTQILVPSAAALLGLAVVAALWLRHAQEPAPTDPEPAAAPSAKAKPADVPTDPQMVSEIRDAYQSSLAENAPPGMIELMQGKGAGQPGEPPPLADPFVVPAGHTGDAGASGDLPPLPTAGGGTPKPLPPLDKPAAGKAPKEGPSPDLPPLPPVK